MIITRKTIFTDEEMLNYLQGLSIEVDSRQGLMSYMITNNMDISSDQFKKYQDEYTKFFAEYQLAKEKLESIIKEEILQEGETLKSWNLVFASKELELKIEK